MNIVEKKEKKIKITCMKFHLLLLLFLRTQAREGKREVG